MPQNEIVINEMKKIVQPENIREIYARINRVCNDDEFNYKSSCTKLVICDEGVHFLRNELNEPWKYSRDDSINELDLKRKTYEGGLRCKFISKKCNIYQYQRL